MLAKLGIPKIRFPNFVSEQATFFQKATDRYLSVPQTPLDIAVINKRVDRLESIADRLDNFLNSYPPDRETELRQRLAEIPPALAKYQLTRVEGIGEIKANELLSRFNFSLCEIYDASVYEIIGSVKGIGVILAERIKEHLLRL